MQQSKGTSVNTHKAFASAAELGMGQWFQQQGIQDRLRRAKAPIQWQPSPYVTISRQAGAGGEELAVLTGELLGWAVLGSELIESISKRLQVPRGLVDLMDETSADWFHKLFGSGIVEKPLTHASYIRELKRTATMATSIASVIFVGRGIQFLLPSNLGLQVRVVGSMESRIRYAMKWRQLTKDEARCWVKQSDRERKEFIHEHFNQDVDDPLHYDLLINTDRTTLDVASSIIANAVKSKFGLLGRSEKSDDVTEYRSDDCSETASHRDADLCC